MDGYSQGKVANGSIDQYADLLRIRKRWALIGIVAFTICAAVSFAFLYATSWTLGDKAMTRLSTLVVIAAFVLPYVGLVSQAVEYRRLNGLLELLDVLERAPSKSEPEDRDT